MCKLIPKYGCVIAFIVFKMVLGVSVMDRNRNRDKRDLKQKELDEESESKLRS